MKSLRSTSTIPNIPQTTILSISPYTPPTHHYYQTARSACLALGGTLSFRSLHAHHLRGPSSQAQPLHTTNSYFLFCYNNLMKQSLYRQLVWDYQLDQNDFESILRGNKTIGQLNQAWAIQRILEHANYYQARTLVPLQLLAKHWSTIKSRIFNPTIRNGYDFLLQRHALSTTG